MLELNKYNFKSVINTNCFSKVISGTVISVDGSLVLIVQGRAGVFSKSNEEVLIEEFRTGDFFGETSFFTQENYSQTAITLTDAVILKLNRESYAAVIRDNPTFSYDIEKEILMRISGGRDKIHFPGEKTIELAKNWLTNSIAPGKRIQLAIKISKPAVAQTQTAVVQTQAATAQTQAATAQTQAVAVQTQAVAAVQTQAVAAAQTDTGAVIISDANGIFPKNHKKYAIDVPKTHAAVIYTKEITCPVCKAKVVQERVMNSKLKLSDNSSALHTLYQDFDMIWHDLTSCSNCLYTHFNANFETITGIEATKIKKALESFNKEELSVKSVKTIDDVFTKHYLALKTAESFREPFKFTGNLWLHLFDLYEIVEDKELMELCARNTFNCFEQLILTSHDLSNEGEQKANLIMGEMLVLLGEIKEGVKYLYKAKANRQGKPLLARQAEDILDELKLKNPEFFTNKL